MPKVDDNQLEQSLSIACLLAITLCVLSVVAVVVSRELLKQQQIVLMLMLIGDLLLIDVVSS